MGKKGQITIFIIIGVILLLSLGLYVTITAPEGIPELSKAPVEAQPVQRFIEDCLKTTTVDGLKQLGDHGGYIDTSSLDGDRFNPTKGNAVYVEPLSNLLIPYWYHLSSSNNCEKTGNCQFSSLRPSASAMKTQLEAYVNSNLQSCFNDFQDFPATTVKTFAQPKTTITFGQEDMGVLLDYKVEINKQGKTYVLEKYFTPVDLNLRELYNLANEIITLQSEHQFFEKHIMNLLSLNGETDKQSLPPFEGSEIKYGGGTVWVKSIVKDKVKDHILPQTALLRVFGTLNGNPIFTTGPTHHRTYSTNIVNKCICNRFTITYCYSNCLIALLTK